MTISVSPTRLRGLLLIEPVVHGDSRGFFLETFRRHEQYALGVTSEFVQDNHSRSARGVVRGIHFHIGDGVAKLVRCGRGRIWDVVVDSRRNSATYGQWEGFELDDERHRQVFVPVGIGHGFCTLNDAADVLYRQTAYHDPRSSAELPTTTPRPTSTGRSDPLNESSRRATRRRRPSPSSSMRCRSCTTDRQIHRAAIDHRRSGVGPTANSQRVGRCFAIARLRL
jgi:dTDP-4-dehydrorhamnose 3,5-epimerase